MASALSVSGATEVAFPITELGNCADKAACKTYCDQPANVDACLSFAEKNNLMSADEINKARNFKKTGMAGPGGCKGKTECQTYCNGPEHLDECVTFAEKNGLMSGKQLDDAKKVRGALAKGIKPPACGGKEACDSYCSSPEHFEECVTFGEASGMISKEDADMIRKGGGKGKKSPPDKKGPPDGIGPDGQGGPGDQGGPGGRPGDGGPNGGPSGGPGPGGGKGPGGPGQGGQGGPGKQGPGGGGKGNSGGGGQGQGGGGNGGGR